MEEGKEYQLVLSDAGYGKSVRLFTEDSSKAAAKASRLAKKGHTAIELVKVQVLSTEEYKAD